MVTVNFRNLLVVHLVRQVLQAGYPPSTDTQATNHVVHVLAVFLNDKAASYVENFAVKLSFGPDFVFWLVHFFLSFFLVVFTCLFECVLDFLWFEYGR